jgi:hypothetical protein
MIGWGAALAWQAVAATVGDTVWITRTVPAPNGKIVRPQVWDLGDLGLALASPDVDYRADSATIRYPIVLWYPGLHRLDVPGPIVVTPAGSSDTLPGFVAVIEVASVLPQGQPKASIAPRGAAPLLAQSTRSLFPAVLFLALTALVAGGWYWLRARGRRQREAVAPLPVATEPGLTAVLGEWRALGETRAALDGWAHLIERELAGIADPGRVEEARRLLARMELVGFRPDSSSEEAEALVDQARAWIGGPA